MPLFRGPEILFIHIPKNAGRSIETVLFPAGVSSMNAKRSLVNRAAHWTQTATANRLADSYLAGTIDVSLAGQHLALAEIELLGIIPPSEIDNLFKFCVVRNPFARAISSILHFEKRFSSQYSLDESPTKKQVERALSVWLEHECEDHNIWAHRRSQAAYVRRGKQANAMNMTLRFERLAEDFQTLRAHR